MNRVYNFAPGPAMLPTGVLEIAQREMLDWHNTGMSVMEISHRSAAFIALLDETEQLLRTLMSIPANYKILFLPGGARTQFAAIPLNLLAQNSTANYLVTGTWSKVAYEEAQKYGAIHLVASSAEQNFFTIPEPATWNIENNASYFYYTPNETIVGVEFPNVPQVAMPVVADMTSCILSKEYPIDQFGLIFASAQKNLGQAGVTVVIVREDLVTQPLPATPSMFDYGKQIAQQSSLNTTPTYAIYIMNLVLKDLQAKGGVPTIAKLNEAKAQLLYATIDQSNYYVNQVPAPYRSRMNVTFNLPTTELDQRFCQQATQAGLTNLKGHSSVGGIRASLYNAMPLAGVEALVTFMQKFASENPQ
jgi:phosphoserine aminotransferase